MIQKDTNLEAYPATPFDEIAMAVSGGGFRAAAYALGTFIYLNKIEFKQQSLLQRVKFISSASGGSIAVAFYLCSLHKKQNFAEFTATMLRFLTGEEVLKSVFKKLNDPHEWERSPKKQNLINSFAKVYDAALGQVLWKAVWDLSKNPNIPLKEVCFNTTDFQSGLTFRFQTAESNTKNLIGNNFVSLTSLEAAGKLRLGDLVAASSCFPVGFEPLIFPQDFSIDSPHEEALKASIKFVQIDGSSRFGESFALMDGGITDNQGVESMSNAFNRRKKKSRVKPFDLMIVTDVSNRVILPMKIVEKKVVAKKMSVEKIIQLIEYSFFWNKFLLITVLLLLFFDVTRWLGLLVLLPSLGIFWTGLKFSHLKNKVTLRVQKIVSENTQLSWELVKQYAGFFLNLDFSTLKQLIADRLNSVSLMSSEVFLKRIRRLTFNRFYENKSYDFRRISNFIYDLSEEYRKNPVLWEDKKVVNPCMEDQLRPNAELMKIAENARTMSTTLWFDAQHIRENRLKDIMATAQFTICNNLIKYMATLEAERHLFRELEDKDELLQLKQTLLQDWKKFQENPYFLSPV